MAATIEVKYFNSFILRKTATDATQPSAVGWNGSRGDATLGTLPQNMHNWAVEEARIRGGYNNTYCGQGVKAFLVEESPNASFRTSSLIYSGIFNSRTGINDSNVFSVGEDITKSVDPSNGSIQKIYAEGKRHTATSLSLFKRTVSTFTILARRTSL